MQACFRLWNRSPRVDALALSLTEVGLHLRLVEFESLALFCLSSRSCLPGFEPGANLRKAQAAGHGRELGEPRLDILRGPVVS
jgi:hypothetical protein